VPGILLAAPPRVEPSQVQGPDFVAPNADGRKPPVNAFGAAVRDADGHGINYSREELARLEATAGTATKSVENPPNVVPQGFVPAGNAEQPFWHISIFGSGIGASNIIIAPAPAGGGAREIIIGGNSANDYGPDDFWQVIRRDSATGRYDGIFVSPIYTAILKRIAVGNVVGDSQQEIAAMLANGRIHLYDLTTKAELGYIDTGINGLEGLSLVDLDGDGSAEVIVTTVNDLFVFNGAGALLWQVAGAGGYEVVAGQMDNDPALEVATTNNKVVDAVTHTVQWTRPGALAGTHLKLAPLPGGNYQQLIVAEWTHVYACDVALQLQRWSIPTNDVGGIEIADVDNDGTPEVIIGDNQFGAVHVHDLTTQAQKWAVNNPEHGVTGVAVGDVDNDGVADLVWGAGWTSSGPDYLYVASTTGTHAIKWQSLDLFGPFSGPLLGDLDGDGQPELVVCSGSAPAHDSGRIFVFDLATLTLRGMSAPIGSNSAGSGRHDMKLYDLEGDGRMEIVVAANAGGAGIIEVYEFDSSNNFSRKWRNTNYPTGVVFNFVEVADLDGNGTPEIIAGNSVVSTGSLGVCVYIYDYPNGGNPWRSVSLASSFERITGLVVEDFDGDGGKEIAALVSTGYLYTFDGFTRQLESVMPPSGGRILSRRSPLGLIYGDILGVGHFLKYSDRSYSENFSLQLGPATPSGLNVLSDGQLWVGAGGRLSLRVPPSYDSVQWQGPLFGTGCGRVVATAVRNNQAAVFASAQHAVAGFTYESPLPSPTPPPTPIPSPTPIPTPTPTPTATPTSRVPTARPTPTPAATP
jgi:hypothetical protein